ncbi:Scr1 family TA system antitoxin-like transcriptional regulator [Actinomadura sp. SCN-SB]|uniref:helix-turn-helix domain-containing protein n=1 Tax=Actinomadura sp. SCN-SB TaxID=3373092 RepID=UPI0037515EB4
MAPKRETALQLWGKELAHAREAAGLTGKQLAEAIYVAPSTIGMWETGKRVPKLKELRLCEDKLGTRKPDAGEDAPGYLERLLVKWVSRDISPEWSEWKEVEEQASTVLWYELSVVPGLLQTPDYARAVLQYNHQAPMDLEQRVLDRLERQAVLEQGDPPTCVFVMDEYAIRRCVGGPKVMHEQLVRLLELAEHPDIIMQIIPAGTEYSVSCPFVIAKVDGAEIAHLDDALTGRMIEGHEKVSQIVKTWQRIHSAALPDKASLELMEKVAESWKL